MLSFLLNLFYPPKCPGCGRLVSVHGQWCDACLLRVWHPRLLNCPASLRYLDGCYALTDYHGSARRILHDLKYRGKESRAASCQYFLARFPWQERLQAVDFVVPVPLSPEKKEKRGYNQVDLIFQPWAEKHWSWQDILQRRRLTQSQWRLKREERQHNVQHAFSVRPGVDVAGKHILLVDDIFTTGATLDACAQALKQKKAASVTGLVIASGAP